MASPALSPLSTFAKIACAGEVQQKKGGGTERRAKKQENKRTISPCRPSLQQDCLLSLARGGEKRGTRRRRAV